MQPVLVFANRQVILASLRQQDMVTPPATELLVPSATGRCMWGRESLLVFALLHMKLSG
jgi:hypothetical protein